MNKKNNTPKKNKLLSNPFVILKNNSKYNNSIYKDKTDVSKTKILLIFYSQLAATLLLTIGMLIFVYLWYVGNA